MKQSDLKSFLDEKVEKYNRPAFIENDPITIPHSYSKKQDIEITGFFTSILAWGQRKTIINKSKELFERMDNAPYDFMRHHSENDLKAFESFKHRTFNSTDCLYFIRVLSAHYRKQTSLESAFVISPQATSIEEALVHFRHQFFSMEDYPPRTRKHIATPERKSACKRINMFLRWMVRTDKNGVDFGIWKEIKPSQLICPCDVHVERVARKLKLIHRKQMDWQTALELTASLKRFDPQDPVKYDFALFGLGIEERF